MNDEQPNFKVTDRRLFNADGSPRELTAEEQAAVKAANAPAKPEPAPATAPSTEAAPPKEQPARKQDQPQPEVNETEEAELPDVEDPASFANFLMSIASNAASSLGMMEHPVTRKREVDLELGKHWIDVLGMLQQKTRGNLSSQEAQVLEGLLADLRMQFVSLANSTTQQPRAFTSGDITGGR